MEFTKFKDQFLEEIKNESTFSIFNKDSLVSLIENNKKNYYGIFKR